MASPQPGSAPIRVLIADDHGLVRAGLRSILSGEPDIAVVGEAENGEQALALAIALRPDIILVDISMPPPDGIEVARRLTTQLPGSRTLVVSMHEDANMLRDALSAGASGYLIKRALEHELTRAIRMVATGQQYIHEVMQQYLTPMIPEAAEQGPPEQRPPDLDEHEIKLLRLLAKGANLKRLAEALGTTGDEANGRRNELMARLGLSSRIDVIKFVARNKLADD